MVKETKYMYENMYEKKGTELQDELILVDIYDNEIGTCGKMIAHNQKKLHRAFSVFIYDGSKMLIQKRAKTKYHSAGLWANACCSHPRKGEPIEETVPRRMMEELSFYCDTEELFSFVYFTKYSNTMYEYEYDHVFLGKYHGLVVPNEEEVEQYAWIEIEELKDLLLFSPERFASWFLIAAPKVIKEIEARNR